MANTSSRRTQLASELDAQSEMGQAGIFLEMLPIPSFAARSSLPTGSGWWFLLPGIALLPKGRARRRVTHGCCGAPG